MAMTARKKILLVKPVLPYPPDQGTKVVSFAIVEALAGAFDVTVLARILDRGEEELARALTARGVRVVTVLPLNRSHRAARFAFRAGYLLRSLFTGRSLKSQYDCPGSIVRAARALAREGFDLVVLEYWQLYPLLDVFAPERTVLLTHDIDLVVNRDRARLERGVWARAGALARWWMERREELRAYRRAPRVLALTTRDAEAARTLSGGRASVDVLPFGLPATSFAPAGPGRVSREVLFLGAMGAAFNRDALLHFVGDIYPSLSTIEGIRFTVVGGDLPGGLEAFGEAPNVEVAGHARDVRPFLDRAVCLVVPLRYGGGLRIRIIEAMAVGLPVVASPTAVEGMAVVAGEHVLVANTPADYRSHVARLIGDPGFAAGLAARARDYAWTAYGPETRGPGLRACVERLAR
jgi:glycosyltransferase involved in cell wall biosynthesis